MSAKQWKNSKAKVISFTLRLLFFCFIVQIMKKEKFPVKKLCINWFQS